MRLSLLLVSAVLVVVVADERNNVRERLGLRPSGSSDNGLAVSPRLIRKLKELPNGVKLAEQTKLFGYPFGFPFPPPWFIPPPYGWPRYRGRGRKHKKKKNKNKNNNNGNNPTPTPAAPRIPTLKLHYFDIRLRGEPARLMLHYKNVQYEDNRINPADWPKLKPTYPNGQLPVLDIDGKPLAQSFAIYHYLGKLLNLAGADELENGKIESLGEEFRELLQKVSTYIGMVGGTKGPVAQNVKDQELQTNVRPAINAYMPKLEKALKESSSGFFGDDVSWLDFLVADFTKTLRGLDTGKYMTRFKQLKDHMDKVYELPGVKEYVATRKDTPI